MVTTRPPKTIVKPTALGPVANTDTKLLIYGLFSKGPSFGTGRGWRGRNCSGFLLHTQGWQMPRLMTGPALRDGRKTGISSRGLEAFEAQRKPVSIGSVLYAARQVNGSIVEPF